MSALRPAFFIPHLDSFISRLNVIPCHDLTLSVSEPENAAAQTGAGTSFGANGDQHTRAAELSTYFCVLTIQKHLLKIRFERSGRGQEPSRGHKFSILENFLSIRDFTSQTLSSFPSDLVGVALVGATPLHLLSQTALPLKSPTGAFVAAQTRACLWQAEQAHHANNEKQEVPACWVFVKQFSRNDTATACQDWLRAPG